MLFSQNDIEKGCSLEFKNWVGKYDQAFPKDSLRYLNKNQFVAKLKKFFGNKYLKLAIE